MDKIIDELQDKIEKICLSKYDCKEMAIDMFAEIDQFKTKLKEEMKNYLSREDIEKYMKEDDVIKEIVSNVKKDAIPISRVEECIKEIKEEGTIPASFRNIIINKLQSLLNPIQEKKNG